MRTRRRAVASIAALLATAGLTVATPAWAQPGAAGGHQAVQAKATVQPAAAPSSAPGKGGAGPRTRVEDPDASLAKGWRTSTDRAVSVVGDAEGLHVLVADSADAYEWHEAALLREQGFDADSWIGNSCVTASGRRAVVVYAPRTFTNSAELFDRGAFAAVVDLDKGTVTKLGANVSLAYFNPGCGAGENAVLSQAADVEQGKTRLLNVDTAKAAITARTVVPGQVTSAVPVADGMVAAQGDRLTHISPAGKVKTLVTAKSVPFRIHPDSGGGIDFMVGTDKQADVRRLAGGKNVRLAHGGLGKIGLQGGGGGRVFVTGQATEDAALPDPVSTVKTDAGSVVSSHGQFVVDQAVSAGLASKVASPLAQPDDPAGQPLELTAHVPATGADLTFSLPSTGAPASDDPSPSLATAQASGTTAPARTASAKTATSATTAATATAAPATATAADDAHSTVDANHSCAVPRNDPTQQALQPTPNQVEWAVDMAIRGVLTSNWLQQGSWRAQDGLGPAVMPSGMFPLPELTVPDTMVGARIPAQVLLGILAQESNLWQASFHAAPGQMGNPLVGNYYGTKIYKDQPGYDPGLIWVIDWSKHDCGYGVGQQTDGMSLDQDPSKPQGLPADEQRAIALDYASNIAVAAQTLAKKWNELHVPGQTIKINNDDPQYIENWFAAVWNYNEGFNAPSSGASNWGLGWSNNPANPKYPKDRFAFLDTSYSDAAKPQLWPYEEKVMGWAAYPIDTNRSFNDSGVQDSGNTHGYQQAWWANASARTRVKPALSTFCNSNNGCDTNNIPDCTGNLGCFTDLWYHSDAQWKICQDECGHETLTYKTLRMEPGRGNSQLPNCATTGLPSNALIIDDVSTDVPSMRSDCGKSWSNAGALTWDFYPTAGDAYTTYEGKEDFHQVGGGFGNHFWFAHTRNPAGDFMPNMKVTGTWTLDRSLNQWARVMVHLPSTGGQTQQAHYRIYGISGKGTAAYDRYINQGRQANAWISLGVYQFAGTPKVTLSNETADGAADEDIAWDAIAFQPLAAKPKHIVAALGDSYSSGEGAGDYFQESDENHDTSNWDACRRSKNAWPRKLVLPGQSSSLGTLSDAWSTQAELGFVACSGAWNWNINGSITPNDWGDRDAYKPDDGQFHEMDQLDSGVLDKDTTLVTLTVGGNDQWAFTDAVTDCAQGNCDTDSFLTKYEGIIDQDIVPNIATTIDDINKKAQNADIVLVSYPAILSTTLTCLGSGYILPGEADNLAALAKYLNDAEADLVGDISLTNATGTVAIVSPMAKFAGHAACDSDAWINAAVVGPNGDGDFHKGDPQSQVCTPEWVPVIDPCLSRESFHPNKAGTTAYAEVVDDWLTSIGYNGG